MEESENVSSGDETGHKGDDGRYQTQYDWSTTRPSTAVIESVAAAANRVPGDVEPIYDYVDPDALDAIVGSESAARNQDLTTVVFTFTEYEVTVYSDGVVVVEPTVETA